MKTWMLAVVGLSCAFTVGCGDDSETGDGEEQGQNKTGITECGPTNCQAGQYCVSNITCEPGCTSDVNCSGSETCNRPDGQSVGACEGGTAPGKDCAAFKTLCTGCGGSDQQCGDACASQSAGCIACAIADDSCSFVSSCTAECTPE